MKITGSLLTLTFLSCLVAPAHFTVAAEGDWQVLFNGQNLEGWQNSAGREPGAGWGIEDGAIVRQAKGAGYIWTEERFGDFVLDLEFMTEGNSGVFIRTDNVRDPVQTGIEIAINRPADKPDTHSTGALYDLLAPTKVADKPSGQWNHMVITAKDNKVMVELNGEQVVDADLNRWTEAHQNPDGSRNKFNTALKDFKREGHIGLQDHGAKVAFRNIKVKPLD